MTLHDPERHSMNSNVECLLGELLLRSPGSELDRRVLAALNSQPGESRPRSAEGPEPRQITVGRPEIARSASETGRTGMVLTSAWLTAVVSMMVGIGSATVFAPFFSGVPGASQTASGQTSGQAHFRAATEPTDSPVSTMPEETPHQENSLTLRGVAMFSPSEGAVQWEQVHQQIFRVRGHQMDRRFAECLACHRSGW